MSTKSLGICFGSSAIKTVQLTKSDDITKITNKWNTPHNGNPRETFKNLIKKIDLKTHDHIMITGRKFRTMVNAPSITEPESVEHALQFMKQNNIFENVGAVASLGAENFIIYALDQDGAISSVETGNKCASGTGEFFLQQIQRMDISTKEAVELAEKAQPFSVSGRCSVFCKSDCTHALNKGIPVGRVSAGLCRMMSEKILDLLQKVPDNGLIATGGITNNNVIMRMVGENISKLIVPDFADVFEAVGAAWYAMIQKSPLHLNENDLFKKDSVSFNSLPPILDSKSMVDFKSIQIEKARKDDTLIIGLDVGSTTTKAIALRTRDNSIVASVYLRTNGNPIEASRNCYKALLKQIPVPVTIVGLGTTGSGRQIAGLHAGTRGVINEIIAHAAASAFFDKDVTTIFEIGGQDAKYTFLTNGVASDYAMNEACSAGTGSFLEESAGETLSTGYREIESIALRSTAPPNFNDQCAAFISSDIQTASHEGISKEDIIAGLVYSICMNYVNRVKGQRPCGEKIFMQGGVCYNKAIPLAMANLIGKPIVVPPEPGLMGAFGVALEIKKRINDGLIEKASFNLGTLINREVAQGRQFRCAGGGERCDRNCEINTLIIENKKYPFGGACNKYYNQLHNVKHDRDKYNIVAKRQQFLFNDFTQKAGNDSKTVGINRSFLTNMLFPLYSTFFSELGLKVVTSGRIDPKGMKRKRSSYCFPAEIAHGALYSLLEEKPDFLFLPKVVELYVENAPTRRREHQCTCLLLQSEPYFLKSAFKDMMISTGFLSPVLDFSQGYESQTSVFASIAHACGYTEFEGASAYHKALKAQNRFNQKLKQHGKKILQDIESDPDQTAIVLFGRPYNAFSEDGNLGIPAKFASRGITIIPWDFLPFENEKCPMDMNWAIGQNIMKAALFVERHPQLFGAYITNFSCGPDSFLTGYFRDIMKSKPSLTLELDSHTADAGVDTRIEAFLDIVDIFRKLEKNPVQQTPFIPARISYEKKPVFISSQNSRFELTDPSVHLLFPSMGELSSELIAATFSGAGIRASSTPVYDSEVMKLGKGHASCKECLPLILTTGGLLNYIKKKREDENLVYFMPTSGGNCRLTQYNIYISRLIEKLRIPNVALLSLTNENGYAGLAVKDALNVLKSIIVSDCMEDVKNALDVLAVDKQSAEKIFSGEWGKIVAMFKSGHTGNLFRQLGEAAKKLSLIPLKYPLSKAKKVSLLGEIFVRRDNFSSQDLIQRLQSKDIVVRKAPVFEWLEYCDYNVNEGIFEAQFDIKSTLEFRARVFLQHRLEKKIKSIMETSGLYTFEMTNMKEIINYGKHFFDPRLTGEAILVTGSFFRDILHSTHGAIQIGPFACMPTRVVEGVLSAEATVENKRFLDQKIWGKTEVRDNINFLPFLTIESDGNPFPQIIESRIEAFCLQVERLHSKLAKTDKPEQLQKTQCSPKRLEKEGSLTGCS
ncbi:CoA-substrate-specific enzyme activase [Chitinispirillum alkaliphilum]|nr:CoA-substrate-specific enzyme activase [Chitinispirillum alkaliphilum]